MKKEKLNILLVDDDQTDIQAIIRAFNDNSENHNISVALNLFEAKAQFSEISPDIVVTDLLLPDGTGIELLPSEKKDLICPFIILSGKGDEEKAVDAMKRGALNYLVKTTKTLSLIPVFVKIALQEWEILQEKKHVEKEMIKAKEEAERANLAKSEFLARVSHELRTPMNSILGFGQLLNMNNAEPLTATQKKNVEYILKAGNHLLSLINELLDLSKIESGKVTFCFGSVDVKSLIDDLIIIVKPLADEKKIKFYNRLSSESEFFVWSDVKRLRQILLNLMANAIKYNRADGTVEFEGEKTSNGRICIKVKDTGVGISKDNFDEVFNSFSRIDNESTLTEGTGIGLNVAKGLVELMDGSINLDSVVGKGSCFTLDLPACNAVGEK